MLKIQYMIAAMVFGVKSPNGDNLSRLNRGDPELTESKSSRKGRLLTVQLAILEEHSRVLVGMPDLTLQKTLGVVSI